MKIKITRPVDQSAFCLDLPQGLPKKIEFEVLPTDLALKFGDALAVAMAQSPPSASLGEADPTAPLRLTPAEKTAILNAVSQENRRPSTSTAPDSPVSVGVQLPPSIALRILPDTAPAQAPGAKTVQYIVIENQVVLVDPTNMREISSNNNRHRAESRSLRIRGANLVKRLGFDPTRGE
jgi:Protein of unknown function (DUF1236)